MLDIDVVDKEVTEWLKKNIRLNLGVCRSTDPDGDRSVSWAFDRNMSFGINQLTCNDELYWVISTSSKLGSLMASGTIIPENGLEVFYTLIKIYAHRFGEDWVVEDETTNT